MQPKVTCPAHTGRFSLLGRSRLSPGGSSICPSSDFVFFPGDRTGSIHSPLSSEARTTGGCILA